MKRNLVYFLPVLALLGAAPASVRAEIVWGDEDRFRLEWSHTIPGSILLADNETNAGVTVSQESGNYGGGSSFVAANLQTLSKGTLSNPSLLIQGGWYDLTVTVYDRDSGESQSHTFASNKLGVDTYDPNKVYPNLATAHDGASFGKNFSLLGNKFGSTSPWTWTTTQGGTYLIWLDNYTPVDSQSASGKGAIGGRVQYIPAGVIQKVPEPSSLLMGAFGLTLAGGAWWRKRRQTVIA